MESKVDVKDLKIGMFVADLDRPWIDTPFLLQGFVIETQKDILQLRRYCKFVVIDRARSTGEEYAAPPKPAAALPTGPGNAGIARPTAPEPARPPRAAPAVVPPEPPAEDRQGLLSGLKSRFQGFLRRGPRPARPELAAEDVPDLLTEPSLPPPVYPDLRTVEEEVTPARQAYVQTTELLRDLEADVWAGHPVAINRVEEVVNEMVESMVRNADALMWVARLREKDSATYGHGLMVAVYLVAFGRHIGFPREELAQLGTIGLLLDIGKTRLPRELLERQGPLTPIEFETVKTHVKLGLDILQATPNWPAEIIEGISQHHERMNGSGYPNGLAGDEIGTFGRMSGIADCFAALTSHRPYAEAVSSYQALRSISGWGGEFFHEALAEQFVQAVGVFPVGSLVELSTGEVAVVVSHNRLRRLKPRVLLLTSPDKTPSAYPVMVDLLYDPKLGGEEPAFIRRGLPNGAYGLDPREHYLS